MFILLPSCVLVLNRDCSNRFWHELYLLPFAHWDVNEISLLQCCRISILSAPVENETSFHQIGADIYVMAKGPDAPIECRIFFPSSRSFGSY